MYKKIWLDNKGRPLSLTRTATRYELKLRLLTLCTVEIICLNLVRHSTKLQITAGRHRERGLILFSQGLNTSSIDAVAKTVQWRATSSLV